MTDEIHNVGKPMHIRLTTQYQGASHEIHLYVVLAKESLTKSHWVAVCRLEFAAERLGGFRRVSCQVGETMVDSIRGAKQSDRERWCDM